MKAITNIKGMQKNVFGEKLQLCGDQPLTGFYRDGHCKTGIDDRGSHTVCAMMTDDFLAFSKSMGNDLITPVPAFHFPGLKAGDRWCLCASRWLEAHREGVAPKLILEATHENLLRFISLNELVKFAWKKD